MNRSHLLAAAALAAAGVLAWDLLRPAPAPESPVAEARAAARPALEAPRPSAPLGPAQVGATPHFLRPPAGTAITATPLARDFGNAVTLRPLYDRLRNSMEGQTPEGQFYLYRILRACATVSDRKGGAKARTARNAARLEERRQQIAASLKEGDPRRAQRLAAFDKATADECEGLDGVTVTQAELDQLLRNALDGGDPKARAWQVEQEMWQERRSASSPRAGATLTDEQVASLRDAFSSRDPEAIAIAGRVLANSFRDLTVRIGPDQEPIEHRAFMNAALLLACEYGYACGENNPRVLNACAFQGHCGVASLPDYLFYYGTSPYDAQLLDRYRAILRQAVDTGDWSAVAIERGARSPNIPSYSHAGPYGGH